MTRKDTIRKALREEWPMAPLFPGQSVTFDTADLISRLATAVEAALQQWENDRWTVEIDGEGNCTVCDGWSDAWFSRGPVRDVCIDCVRGSGGDTND